MNNSMGSTGNALRLIHLRQELFKADQRSESDLVDAYVKKIAGISAFEATTGSLKNPADLQANKEMLEEIWEKANRLLNGRTSGFLFAADPCTADCFFVPIVFRMEELYKADLEAHYAKYPDVKSYYERVKASEAGQSVVKYTLKGWGVPFMCKKGAPCGMIAMKLGCLRAPELPVNLKKRINEALREKGLKASSLPQLFEDEASKAGCFLSSLGKYVPCK